MQLFLNVLKDTVIYIFGTIAHNFVALAFGVLIAALIKVYLDPEKMKRWLTRRSKLSIPATVAFGALTPLCACGTMAVVMSMLATALPWGPIMAFLTSSPLMSPEGFILLSGIIGPSFALTLGAASIFIGLASGFITHVIERKTDFLKDQLRFADPVIAEEKGNCCSNSESVCNCGSAPCQDESALLKIESLRIFFKKHRIDSVAYAAFDIGIKRILPLFSLFAGIGYLINLLIPSTWITAIFGAQNMLAVPLAALIGIPLYVSGDSSIPLIQSLMESGVSTGAMLAFMVTGPGTSAGVIAGISTIIKKRAVALYVAYLLFGGIVVGYAYDWIETAAL